MPANAERLNQHKRWLVERGDQIGEKAAEGRDWASQGRLLLEAARSETDLHVLLNLLRYQYARNHSPWEPCFGALMEALKHCEERASGPGDAPADPALAMDLARHLLLYVIRSHRFHDARRQAAARGGR